MFSTRDFSLRPFDEPSQRGLTMRGNFIVLSLATLFVGSSVSKNFGVGIFSEMRIFFVIALSRLKPRVRPSEPTKGMCIISRIIGTCDSRFLPDEPSEILKT